MFFPRNLFLRARSPRAQPRVFRIIPLADGYPEIGRNERNSGVLLNRKYGARSKGNVGIFALRRLSFRGA